MKETRTILLNNGVQIPILGLGVFQSAEGPETRRAVKWAIESGYQHIDTARAYGNETSVGAGLKDSGTDRSKLFITTKVANEDVRAGNTERAFFDSLQRLGLDYLDLYLIHWPVDRYAEAWATMEKLYRQGYIRSIGVCNFHAHHLETLAKTAEIMPAVNQVECHPLLTQRPLKDYCKQRGIAVEAWSPLGGTGGNLLKHELLNALAEKYQCTTAQLVLAWDLQHDTIVIPKSIHKERIQSNIAALNLKLDKEDVRIIDSLNRNQRVGPDPDNFDF